MNHNLNHISCLINKIDKSHESYKDEQNKEAYFTNTNITDKMKNIKNSNVVEEFKKPFNISKKAQKVNINNSFDIINVRLEKNRTSEDFISKHSKSIY